MGGGDDEYLPATHHASRTAQLSHPDTNDINIIHPPKKRQGWHRQHFIVWQTACCMLVPRLLSRRIALFSSATHANNLPTTVCCWHRDSKCRIFSSVAMEKPVSSNTATNVPEEIPEGFMLIKEGQASMLFPSGNEVFYNKVQVLNRDLSIMMLRLFAERRLRDKEAKRLKKEGLTPEQVTAQLADVDWTARVAETAAEEGLVVLDALAASGLRSIRYFKEVPGIKKIVVNDLEEPAVEQAHRNVAYNRVDPTRVVPQQGNATLVMYQHAESREQFDVIDIDPYGSAAPFMDAAVQAVANGGLLCVTCTDLAVLNGNHPEVCWGKYRAMPTKARYMHEMAVRIVLQALETQANRYRRYIVPLLSVGIDFYLRVFVRVFTSPAEVKKASLKMAYVHQSLGCGSFYLQTAGKYSGDAGNGSYQASTGPTCPPVCPETGAAFRLGGPIWSAPMHDMEWVLEALGRAEEQADADAEAKTGLAPLPTTERMVGLLTAVSEELVDVPLHYTLQDMAGTLHCTCPRVDDVKAALINAGYRVSSQHKEPRAFKTDAPPEVMWDIMRCWVQKHPVGPRGQKESSPAAKILAKAPKLQANFSWPPELLAPKKKVSRYPPNPEAFWGPKSKAKGRKRKMEEGGREKEGLEGARETTMKE